jgi:hypothetical protein
MSEEQKAARRFKKSWKVFFDRMEPGMHALVAYLADNKAVAIDYEGRLIDFDSWEQAARARIA